MTAGISQPVHGIHARARYLRQSHTDLSQPKAAGGDDRNASESDALGARPLRCAPYVSSYWRNVRGLRLRDEGSARHDALPRVPHTCHTMANIIN